MITYPITPLSLPFVLGLWAIDAYVFAVVARIVLVRLSATRNATATRALGEIVDPVARAVEWRMWAGACKLREHMTGKCPRIVADRRKSNTDPISQGVARRLSSRRQSAAPAWAPWFIMIGGAVVVRSLLVAIIVHLPQ